MYDVKDRSQGTVRLAITFRSSQRGQEEAWSTYRVRPPVSADVHVGLGPFPHQGAAAGEEPQAAAGAEVARTHANTHTHAHNL